MKKRYLAVLSALFLTACIAGGCSFSLEEKLITGKDLLTSQIQEYKDTVYKHAADDAPFISYDITCLNRHIQREIPPAYHGQNWNSTKD